MWKSLINSSRSSSLMALALPCITVAALAASDPPVTTAGLMQQAGDPTALAEGESTASPYASEEPAPDSGFDTEMLEQLVAPIALYPDALLMQILMASTYPLEIVEANRWISKQPDLTGDALNEALKEEDWDPSVKSLTNLPSVLSQMSENLDWTQDLGDAFLAQQNDLMDTVQRMRGLAYEAGNLETTEQQTITEQEDKIIIIESTSPEVIYVPTYSPTVVYGPGWGYPHWYYPRWYYPPAVGYGMVAFGAGVVVGAAIWGGARWGWGRNQVNVNINRQNNFNRNTSINTGNRVNPQGNRGGTTAWQHDSSHRKGVNYGSSNVAQKYGGNSGSNRVTQNQARGHSAATTGNRAAATTGNRAGTSNQAGNRGATSPRTSNAGANRSTASSRPSASTANRGGSSNYSALSGSRSPSTDRMSSSRGASSRGSRSYGGSRGGMSRGGGRRR